MNRRPTGRLLRPDRPGPARPALWPPSDIKAGVPASGPFAGSQSPSPATEARPGARLTPARGCAGDEAAGSQLVPAERPGACNFIHDGEMRGRVLRCVGLLRPESRSVGGTGPWRSLTGLQEDSKAHKGAFLCHRRQFHGQERPPGQSARDALYRRETLETCHLAPRQVVANDCSAQLRSSRTLHVFHLQFTRHLPSLSSCPLERCC